MSSDPQPIEFQLKGISTTKFSYDQGNFISHEEKTVIAFGAEVNVNFDDLLVGMSASFSFEQKNNEILSMTCNCHFKLASGYWDLCVNNNQLHLNEQLLTHLLVLTIGTSRGILHERKPSWLSKLMLPTINVTEIFKDELIFTIQEE